MQYSHERLMISVYDGALPGKGDSRANLYDSKRWNISGFGAPLGVEGSLSENKNLQWARSRYRVLLCDYITPYHSISYVAGLRQDTGLWWLIPLVGRATTTSRYLSFTHLAAKLPRRLSQPFDLIFPLHPSLQLNLPYLIIAPLT